MKKLCIFDFDGTLVDSITDVAICFNASLEHFGFETHDICNYKQYIGGNLETNVSRLLSEENRTEKNINAVAKYYRELYLNYDKPNTKPFRNIIRTLKILQENDVLLSVHTNKAQDLVESLCEKYFQEIHFQKIIGYSPDIPSKPSPDGVFQLMQFCNVTAEESVYVGDTGTDLKTANNAGIDYILVRWGQGKPEDFTSVSPNKIISTPLDITSHILRTDMIALNKNEVYA